MLWRPVRTRKDLPLTRPIAAIAAAGTLLALAPAAQAADLYAAPAGGAGPGCTSAAAPCGLHPAFLAARSSAGADEIHLAAGTFDEVVSATGDADTDVTLTGAGIGATTLIGPANSGGMVELGADGGTMTLRDLTIDATTAGVQASALKSRLASLTLRRVRIVQSGPPAKQAPAIDADTSYADLVLDAVSVEADTQTGDASIGAIDSGAHLTIRDSTITHSSTGNAAAVYARGPVTIQRSTITHGNANAGYPVRVVNTTDALPVSIDSSLLRGGTTGVKLDLGIAASQVALRGDTIAPATGSTGYGLDLSSNVAASQAAGTIDSSLLIDRSVRQANLTGKVTCSYTNLPATGSSGSPACPTGTTGNPGRNTKLLTAELLLDAGLIPSPGSPAIDTGNPAAVAAGESPTDLLGRPRAGASADVCDAGPGVRDKGAIERYRAGAGGRDRRPGQHRRRRRGDASRARAPRSTRCTRGPSATARAGPADPSVTRTFATPGAASATLTVLDRAVNCPGSATRSFTVAAPAGRSATGARGRGPPGPAPQRRPPRRAERAQAHGDAEVHALGGREGDDHRRPPGSRADESWSMQDGPAPREALHARRGTAHGQRRRTRRHQHGHPVREDPEAAPRALQRQHRRARHRRQRVEVDRTGASACADDQLQEAAAAQALVHPGAPACGCLLADPQRLLQRALRAAGGAELELERLDLRRVSLPLPEQCGQRRPVGDGALRARQGAAQFTCHQSRGLVMSDAHLVRFAPTVGFPAR